MLFAVAEGHLNEEEDQEALQVANEALSIFREQGDENGMADASRIVIHVLCYQDKRKEANKLAKAELERIQGTKEKTGEAKLLLSVAEVNAERRGHKNREDALLSATQAQAMFHKQGDKKMEALAKLTLANVHLKRKGEKTKSAEEAVSAANAARSLFKEVGDKRGEAMAVHSVAAAHVKARMAGKELAPGGWLAAAQEAAQLFQELRLRRLEAWERSCIAQWTAEENPRKALRLAKEALTLCRECNSAQEHSALSVVVTCHLAIKDTSLAWMSKEAGEAVRVAKDGAARFARKGDKFGEGQALCAQALAHLARDEAGEALQVLEKARDLFEDLGDRSNESMVLHLLTQLYVKFEQHDKALTAVSKVSKVSKGFQDAALALEGIYEVHLQRREFHKAMDAAEELQRLCEDAGERKKEAVARLLKCNAHFMQQEFVEAVAVAREAQAIFHDLDALQDEAEALRVIAEVHTAAKEYEAALRAAERARKLVTEAANGEGEAAAAFLVAQIRLLMLVQGHGHGEIPDARFDQAFAADCAEAAECAEEAAAIAKKAGNKKLMASAMCTVAQIHTAALDCDKAFKATDEAMAAFVELEDQRNIASVMCIEADVLLVSGKTNKALATANKALTIFREQGDARGEWVAKGIVEHITGPEEEELPQEQWSEQQWQQYQLEQWQQQQAAQDQGQQEQQLAPQAHPEQAVKKRAARVDTGQRLDMTALSTDAVQRRLSEIVKLTVDIEDEEDFALDQPLMQLGVTSKSAVSLRNALTEELPGINMPFTLIFDYPTVTSMAELVMEQAGPKGGKRRR